ncbi:MAG: preprotein translocase subunit Sec61beta [Thaumarchaeota archaeon]|nr:preprotein translocase subunit Sec61beta [Candidatus Terraquivivens yellowstonensis]MCL7399699.1 preprotein translocase subunit Sec61beta [Candidatus Terraquivivens yellowstonensis]
MSSKRRRREAPMPATMAGLLAFFGEESKGFKIRPEVVMILAVAMVVIVLVAARLWPF